MKILYIFYAAIAYSTFYVLAGNEDVVVTIKQGILKGKEEQSKLFPGMKYYRFYNIPYAEVPTGDLRFKAPRPPKPWKGERDAYNSGDQCTDFMKRYRTYESEDCLNLSVFTPKLESDFDVDAPPEFLPVIVFISGSLFKGDQIVHDYYKPDYLVSKNVVVVTFRQRYGVLGFLNLGTKEVPGNAGLKDQVAVLKWVKQNIAVFGGNHKSVTLVGHSSGAASAILHTVSPMSAGLFHRVVALNGVPSLDSFYPIYVKEKSFLFGKLLGYDTSNTSIYLEILQKVPTKKLFDVDCTLFVSEKITHTLTKKFAHFGPVVEEDFGQERFLVMSPMKAFKLRKVHSVDIMFSYSNMEAIFSCDDNLEDVYAVYNRYVEMFVPTKILFSATPSVILDLGQKIKNHYFGGKDLSVNNLYTFRHYLNLVNMVIDVHRYIKKWPRPGKTFLFQFSKSSYKYPSSNRNCTGADHGTVLEYVFHDNFYNNKLNSTDYKIVQLFTKALTNFVKFGEPSPNCILGVEWIQYDHKTQAWAEFSDDIYVYDAPYEEDIAFWKEIYDTIKEDFLF